jgi:hypothetical protein
MGCVGGYGTKGATEGSRVQRNVMGVGVQRKDMVVYGVRKIW